MLAAGLSVQAPFHVQPSAMPWVEVVHRARVFVELAPQYVMAAPVTEHADAGSQVQPSATPPVADPAGPAP
jgi:hypothetical protein